LAVLCDNQAVKNDLGISMSERINARLSQPLAEFVERMVGEAGLYETPSEYVRDLIRHDMERREGPIMQSAILGGYRDLATGRVFASSGDFKADMAMLDSKEANGWQ
jgi:antitoxin ParD1/3/4